MERVPPPRDIHPADFFLRWVPEAVAGDTRRRDKLGDTQAVVVFDLAGPEGGTYTLRIENGVVEGAEGGSAAADLRVELDVETWRRLNDGEMSAPEALLRRRLRFEGSFLLGLKLHLILG